jgi:putative heme-binding domain-containing protein
MLCLWMSSSPASAQHATAFDIVDGQQAYSVLCATCHGPDGDLVPNVDIGHGVFRQAYSDDQLVAIIQNGIPNTPMQGNATLAEEQIRKIVAYLRSRAIAQSDTLAGDAARGKTLFEGRGECLACHMVAGQGAPLATDLSRIALSRTAAELEVSLRAPEQVVQPNQRFYTVLTNDGERVTGRLMNRDRFTVQLLDENGKLRSFNNADLREAAFVSTPMPALGADWSDQAIADLVEYLVSLRGPTP